METSREFVERNLEKLSRHDRNFAVSLCAARPSTPKQLLWIDGLAQKIRDSEKAPVVRFSGLSAIVSLFDQAAGAGLKYPKMTFQAGESDMEMTLAGPNAAFPGSINVIETRYGDDNRRVWMGRIHRDGRYVPHKDVNHATTVGIVQAMKAFAEDPQKSAAAFGQNTGSCCFCSKRLTDAVSLGIGYGPVCAQKWGLAHKVDGVTADLLAEAV